VVCFAGYTGDPIFQLEMVPPNRTKICNIDVESGKRSLVGSLNRVGWLSAAKALSTSAPAPSTVYSGHTDHTTKSSRSQVGVISIAQILSAAIATYSWASSKASPKHTQSVETASSLCWSSTYESQVGSDSSSQRRSCARPRSG